MFINHNTDSLQYFYDCLKQMDASDASDIYFSVGSVPNMRVHDRIEPLNDTHIDNKLMWDVLDSLLSPKQKEVFSKELELNFPIILETGARFRANLYQQQEQPGLVIRRINTHIPSLKELQLPDIYAELIMRKQGLIILASPSGSGKTTSMASMLDYRNRHGGGHILTIEDPIEFLHENKNCIFSQREVGADTHSFENALNNALRQKADVIVVGEIITPEAMIQALRFSEAGHLCVSTIHANNAAQALKRMISFFPKEMREHAFLGLAQNLLAVFSQKLLTLKDKKRVVATEILSNTGLIRSHITEGKLNEISAVMERISDPNIRTMDQALFELYKAGKISEQLAIHEAENPSNLRLRITQNLGEAATAGQFQIGDNNQF